MSTDLTHPVPRTAAPITADQARVLAQAVRALATAEKRRDAAEAERDKLIVKVRESGVSLRAIAAEVGLSPQGVRNIVERARRG